MHWGCFIFSGQKNRNRMCECISAEVVVVAIPGEKALQAAKLEKVELLD